MAKKHDIRKAAAGAQGGVGAAPRAESTVPGQPVVPGFLVKHAGLLYAAVIAAVTFLFFKVCLDNQFVSWDDPGYVTENPIITNLSGGGLRQIFSTAVMGNYHPLTILSLAIEYSYVQLVPWLYHLDSVLLHTLAAILVYWLVALLTRRPLAAAITALLFALHPMHVESVAWVSARKDVLYGTFYLASLIAYVYCQRAAGGKKWGLYVLALVLFLFSLLSKPVAVVLPVTLLLIDYFEQRKWSVGAVLGKLPFFALSIGFGIKAVMDQRELGVVSKLSEHFNIVDTLTMGGYTFGTYLWKALVPAGLSCFYPYPTKVGNFFPASFYAYPVVVAIVIFLAWKFGRKNRAIVFGALFFVANIALLLQFVPVGNAIIADRYSYIPYIGLFFIVGWLVANYTEKAQSATTKNIVVAGTLAVCLLFGFLSNARCKTWYDSTTLWTDQMEKHLENEYAYNSLGFEYFNKWKNAHSAEDEKNAYDSAQYYLNTALKLNPKYVYPYLTLGIMARVLGRADEARFDFHTAAKLDNGSESPKAYLGLGILYFVAKNLDSSAYYLREAIRLRPNLQAAHANYANLLDIMGKPDEALKEYNLSVALAPGSYESYLNRGRLLFGLKRFGEAFRDYNKAIELNPTSGESYYTRALYYGQVLGNKALAMQDVENAAAYGFKQVDPVFYDSISK
jgi:tetratricopeptide (TPR) repeat protein